MNNFQKNDSGGVSLILAVFTVLLFVGIFTLTLDLGKSQNVSLALQNAVDSTTLSTADSLSRQKFDTDDVDLVQWKSFAKETLVNNMKNISPADKLIDNSFSLEIANDELKISACVNSKNSYAQSLDASYSETRVCSSATASIINITNTEVAFAVDNSAAMLKNITGSNSTTRMAALRNALNKFSDVVSDGKPSYPLNFYLSIMPYSDTVKLDPEVANNWLRDQYAPASKFSGCMGYRGNSDEVTDAFALSNVTKFDRYVGPFSVAGKVRVIAKSASGDVLKQINHRISHQQGFDAVSGKDYDEIWIEFPNGGIINAKREGLYDRIPSEIDYIRNIGASESLEVSLGAPYSAAINSIDIFAMFKREGEIGQWVAYDNEVYADPIASGNFYGANEGQPFGLAKISSPQAFSYITIKAIHDVDNPLAPNDWGGLPHALKQEDDTDFAINRLRFPLVCQIQEALIFERDKAKVTDYVNKLSGDGPTRSNIGLAWGWRALSEKWTGQWKTTEPNLPLAKRANNKKFLIMLTQGKNFSPNPDDDELRQTCTNAKAAGVQLYYITFDVDAGDLETKTRGEACASPNSYYNATTDVELEAAFKTIADQIETAKPVRLLE